MIESSRITYHLVSFRESDGVSTSMDMSMTPKEAFELGVKLRRQGILTYFTWKGKVTYLQKTSRNKHSKG